MQDGKKAISQGAMSWIKLNVFTHTVMMWPPSGRLQPTSQGVWTLTHGYVAATDLKSNVGLREWKKNINGVYSSLNHHSGCSFQMVKTIKGEPCERTALVPAAVQSDGYLPRYITSCKNKANSLIVILVATVRSAEFGLPCFSRSKEAPRTFRRIVGTFIRNHDVRLKSFLFRHRSNCDDTDMFLAKVQCRLISHGPRIVVCLYRPVPSLPGFWSVWARVTLKIGSCPLARNLGELQ